jgi:glucokinase
MSEQERKDYVVGVDLGGTKILAGLYNSKLKCIGRHRLSTKAKRGPDAVIERIARCVREVVDECDLKLEDIRSVGVGAPGSVNPEKGEIVFSPNLPGWKNVGLQKALSKQLGVPVVLENDCNVCTLGVYHVELKAKPKHMVGIFLGTGIGGGLVINGELFRGFNRTAGEVGHMVLEVGGPKCGCGNRGCFEALAGRTALFKKLLGAVKDGKKTVLTDMLGPDLDDLRSGDLRKALKRGDKLVERVIEEAAEYTGIAVANLINVFNPEVVVLGGGMIQQLSDDMMAIVTETAKDYAMTGTFGGVEIVASALGDDAGIAGAAVLAQSVVLPS